MNEKTELRIFIIEPNNKTRYKSFIVCANNEENARRAACAKINPMQIVIPGEPTRLIDPVFSDKHLSRCTALEINIEKIHNTFNFHYKQFDYSIAQDVAVPIKTNNNTD